MQAIQTTGTKSIDFLSSKLDSVHSNNKSRDRILDAFRTLVLAEPFDEISVHRIVKEANVARSTFYAQFANKEDLLSAALDPLLHVLAKALPVLLTATKLTRLLSTVGTIAPLAASS